MVRVDILTSFRIDFTTWLDVWAETDVFFLENLGGKCLRLCVTNQLFSMLKSCFTDCFIWERPSEDRTSRTYTY